MRVRGPALIFALRNDVRTVVLENGICFIENRLPTTRDLKSAALTCMIFATI